MDVMRRAICHTLTRAEIDPSYAANCPENYRRDPAEGSERVRKQGPENMVSYAFLRPATGRQLPHPVDLRQHGCDRASRPSRRHPG